MKAVMANCHNSPFWRLSETERRAVLSLQQGFFVDDIEDGVELRNSRQQALQLQMGSVAYITLRKSLMLWGRYWGGR